MRQYNNFKHWFFSKEYPHNHVWKNDLIWHSIVAVALIIILAIIYSNFNYLNNINFFVRIGKILFLIVSIILLIFCYKLSKNLYYGFKGLANGYKLIISVVFIGVLIFIYLNQFYLIAFVSTYNLNYSLTNPSIDSNVKIGNDDDNNSWFSNTYSDIKSFVLGPQIDSNWVYNFMLIVNEERKSRGLQSMKESTYLNNVANLRFKKMMEQPFISHYGANQYNVGEVVFFPEGVSETSYIDDLKTTAILHWDLLMDPQFSKYGYHIEVGPTITIIGYCSTTEVPGPNIDVKEFFKQQSCETSTDDTIWLVIDMS